MNKTFVLPGWMSCVNNYQLGDGLEIWQEPVDSGAFAEVEYLIGHSLGANFALLNWPANKNAKLILVSPILFNAPLFNWFFRWLRYVFNEGLIISPKDIKSNRLFFGLKKGYRLLKPDYKKIIREIPKENLVMIRGKEDKYFCDQKVAEFVRGENIRLIELPGSGHNWNDDFKKTVEDILSEWQQH